MIKNMKYKIISFWLTHVFLRRIGKRYPDYFQEWMLDLSDDFTARKIMRMRYVGDSPMKFEAIALELNIALRRVFEKHKKIIDCIIGNV